MGTNLPPKTVTTAPSPTTYPFGGRGSRHTGDSSLRPYGRPPRAPGVFLCRQHGALHVPDPSHALADAPAGSGLNLYFAGWVPAALSAAAFPPGGGGGGSGVMGVTALSAFSPATDAT